MATRRPMTEDELKALLDRQLADSVGYIGSEITKDRAKALDYYYGRKTGLLAGEDGRSQVVSRDVLETIESATAQLMQMFDGESIVAFDPTGPEDVAQAQQETDYINHVLMKDNEGFQIIHDWIKDGLLSRVGVVHAGWDDEAESSIEKYTGLLPQDLELLLSDENTELVEKTERTVEIEGQNPDGSPGQPQQAKVCDVRVRVDRERGRVSVCAIPPEEFRISRGLRSIDEAKKKKGSIVAHVFEADEDRLRELGFSQDKIDRIIGSEDENARLADESFARDNPQDSNSLPRPSEDETTQVARCFIKIDWDGDGKAELREIVYAGREIASNEPAEEIPYADWCPVPMPHRFSGQSYADLVMDLQEIRTALTRGMLNNLYLVNEPMTEVLEGQVNLKDLLTRRIGGAVRVKQMESIREITTTPMTAASLQMLSYQDEQRENRTGLSRAGAGMDPAMLKGNVPAENVAAVLNQQMIRLKLVGRLFAERGYRRLARVVHGICRRHQDVPRMVRLRNQFVRVDPREWRERTDLTPTVGIGSGTKQEQIGNLRMLMGLQAQGMQIGIATPQNLYQTMTKLTEALGYKDAQNFWTKPQPPDPQAEMQKAQHAAQLQAMVEGAKEQAKAQGRAAGEAQKAQMTYQTKLAELQQRERAEGRSLDHERQKLTADYQIRVAELNQQAQQFNVETSLQQMNANRDFAARVIEHTHDVHTERAAMAQAANRPQAPQ